MTNNKNKKEEIKKENKNLDKNTEKLILRINRIIGQLRGIEKMLNSKRDCSAVILQIGAIKAAVNNLGLEIAKTEICKVAPEHREKIEAVIREIARI